MTTTSITHCPAEQTSPSALLSQFKNPLECLTAHLMLESAEVLAGVKPANLISIVNRVRPCGRNLYQLWQRHHNHVQLQFKTIRFEVLHERPKSLLVLCYHQQTLDEHLSHSGVRTLLHKAGYSRQADTRQLIAELGKRFNSQHLFPHEIGLFIGYPAKDVAAFMGLVKLPFTCQGPWKIYGNPGQSLSLADNYRKKRQCMGNRLSDCTSIRPFLEQLNTGSQHFFCQPIDNTDHYQLKETA